MCKLISKVRRIFSKNFKEIFNMLEHDNINLNSQQGRFMVDIFVSIRDLDKESLQIFLTEFLFKMENFRFEFIESLEIYSDLVQNENYEYTEDDNAMISNYLFEMPLGFDHKLPLATMKLIASKLSSIINTIIWKKNNSKETTQKF